jgi:phosphoglycerate-specific signal transduction histidine kinase
MKHNIKETLYAQIELLDEKELDKIHNSLDLVLGLERIENLKKMVKENKKQRIEKLKAQHKTILDQLNNAIYQYCNHHSGLVELDEIDWLVSDKLPPQNEKLLVDILKEMILNDNRFEVWEGEQVGCFTAITIKGKNPSQAMRLRNYIKITPEALII